MVTWIFVQGIWESVFPMVWSVAHAQAAQGAKRKKRSSARCAAWSLNPRKRLWRCPASTCTMGSASPSG